MSKGSGGGGRSGRGGGGDAGQPGEVVRAANALQAARDAYDQANGEMRKYTPNSKEYDAAKRKSNEAYGKVTEAGAKLIAAREGTKLLSASERASRSIESSRQNDIMEGGKSFRNPSVYKSNAPPSYKASTSKTDYDKGAWKFPSNPKKGETVVNGYGTKRVWTGTYWQ